MTTAIAYANAAWDWGLPNPVVGRNLDEPDGRVRWLTFEEADAVVEAAKDASRMPLLADLITVALHTGCRKGELLGLVWTRVDLKRTVLPVPGDAPGLRLLRRQAGKDIRGAFSAACSAAGITDFTFHDLRHVAGYRRGKARGNTGPARPVPYSWPSVTLTWRPKTCRRR